MIDHPHGGVRANLAESFFEASPEACVVSDSACAAGRARLSWVLRPQAGVTVTAESEPGEHPHG